MPSDPASRGRVSVIVPFNGEAAEAVALIARLERISLGDDDAILAVDNTAGGVLARAAETATRTRVQVLRATHEYSSYYARNVAAAVATTPWLLFLDADCRPSVSLVSEYFAKPIAPECGLVAGRVAGASDQASLVSRFARQRRHLDQEVAMRHPYMPFAVTANLLVRKRVWEDIGGFCEGIRSAGDQDFCWRAQAAGWRLEYRESAAVEHDHRDRPRDLARQFARYGAGVAWVRRRHPRAGSGRPQVLRRLAGATVRLTRALRGRDLEAAAFCLLDMVVSGSNYAGHLMGNRASRGQGDAPVHTIALAGTFPDVERSMTAESLVPDTTVPAVGMRVEASARPRSPNAALARPLDVVYGEDDGVLERAAATARLLVSRPLRVITYVVGSRRESAARFSRLAATACLAARTAAAPSARVLVAPDGAHKAAAIELLLRRRARPIPNPRPRSEPVSDGSRPAEEALPRRWAVN